MNGATNINRFSDLSPDMQEKLLDYIADRFSMRPSINPNRNGYGLKAQFVSLYCTAETGHVTTECFMEAMVKSGYKAVYIDTKTVDGLKDYRYNVYVKKSWKKPKL